MKLTIIMPVLNVDEFLSEALEGILVRSDYLEILVADGGSTDGTLEKLADYSERYPSIRTVSYSDNGQSDALNKLVEHINTDFFIWLNGDDFVSHLFIDYAFDVLRKLSDADKGRLISITSQSYIFDTDSRLVKFQPGNKDVGELIHRGIWFGKFPCRVWNTKITKSVGEFKNELHYSMDFEMLRRQFQFIQQPLTVHSHKPLGAFRHHAFSKTGNSDNIANINAEMRSLLSQSKIEFYLARLLSMIVRLLSPRYIFYRFAVQICPNSLFGKFALNKLLNK
jgi:glycosyltransferase involved in cell wall biosynthesis